jgi:SNF2 family DNA or RNA helicase
VDARYPDRTVSGAGEPAAPVPEPRWELDAGRLYLVLPDGKRLLPTAAEIFRAEFKDSFIVEGHAAPRPSADLPGTGFSRFPLEARIRLTAPSEDLSRSASCAVELTDGARTVPAVDPDAEYVLTGDQWSPVATETVAEVTAFLRSAGISAPGPITLRQYLDLVRSHPPRLTVDEAPGDEPAPPPAPQAGRPAGSLLSIPLYPYQEAGVARLMRLSNEDLGALLADEMGLGKTAQAIALITVRARSDRGPALIISPATLIENWRRELARFAPDLRVSLHLGGQRTGFPSVMRGFDAVVTSYDTAVRDLSLLRMIDWGVVVLDEAQAIKSPDIRRTIALKQLPRRTAVAMTGTPVENRLQDLWSIVDFVLPGLLGSLSDFNGEFTDTSADAARLEPLVRPLIIRRRICEVARDLPERIYIPQPVELAPRAAEEYEKVRQQTHRQYGAAASLVALTRLRMFCAHPFLLGGAGGDPAEASSKYARLVELLEEISASREKVILFTSYNGMTDMLVSDLPARLGLPTLWLDGRVAVEERQQIVDAFGATPGPAALILNPRAAGTGLNITAATHVIHYNLEWNPAVEDQATARAHRIGQSRPVTVHRLFHPSTVEEVIDQRVSRKRELAQTAVVGAPLDEADYTDILRALQVSPARIENTR